jgi:ATP-binding cassette subfamily F protein 3
MEIVDAVINDPEVKFNFPEAGKCSIPYLELDQATFGYDPKVPILKKIRLVIDNTCRIALVGPNGAGKSTLIKVLLG